MRFRNFFKDACQRRAQYVVCLFLYLKMTIRVRIPLNVWLVRACGVSLRHQPTFAREFFLAATGNISLNFGDAVAPCRSLTCRILSLRHRGWNTFSGSAR